MDIMLPLGGLIKSGAASGHRRRESEHMAKLFVED